MTRPILAVLAATALALCAPARAVSANAPAASGWSDCAIGYSQHLSANSDAGGDTKSGLFSCTRVLASGGRRTFELGALADTPPVGGLLSNQRDTFAMFAGYGEERNWTPDSALIYNVRAGGINGGATTLVRGFIDSVHRWEGKGYSRHGPLSSSARPLVQVSGLHTAALAQLTESGWHYRLSSIESLTAGSAMTAMTLGVQASIQAGGATPVLPTGLPGMGLRTPTGTGAYVGVFSQGTVYDLASEDAGTKRVSFYVKVGGNIQVGQHLSLGIEFTHHLSGRVQQQMQPSYNYVQASIGYRF